MLEIDASERDGLYQFCASSNKREAGSDFSTARTAFDLPMEVSRQGKVTPLLRAMAPRERCYILPSFLRRGE
jgi:hypothetical protein